MTDAYRDQPESGVLSVGDTAPEVVVEDIQREDFVKYAGASGDFNPIHYDEPFAREAGYESVFGQGMLSAGYAAHLAADWFGIGNVTAFSVRFQDQIWPGDTLTVSGTITEIETIENGDRIEAELTTENQNGVVVLTGNVTAEILE